MEGMDWKELEGPAARHRFQPTDPMFYSSPTPVLGHFLLPEHRVVERGLFFFSTFAFHANWPRRVMFLISSRH